MPRFFLSHNHRDKPLVLAVDQVLKTLGFQVWTDRFEIKAGDSLIQTIFDEGLHKSDYVCAFITKNSARSKWVREELYFAFAKFIDTGKPKILLLQFDEAKIPIALRGCHYAKLERQELGETVRQILSSARIPMNSQPTALPYSANDFHDAFRVDGVTYLLASKLDPLDVDPFFDPEAIVFKRRDVFVLRIDEATGEMKSHLLTKARPAHTAMRIIGERLLVFLNDKAKNDDFEMEGRLFTLKTDTLQPTSVSPVFSNHNWGWNPIIDDEGRVHHKDFETTGNPVRINDGEPEKEDWHELVAREQEFRSHFCPFESAYGPGRETGYLRFLRVPPEIFSRATMTP